MFYVYEHIRPDTNAIFYVGKGSGVRAYVKQGRNRYWNNVVTKANGFIVHKVAENLDEELSFLVEQERIDQLRRLGIKLTNITDGGEGVSNPSEESRKIKSQKMSGSNNPRFNINSRRQRAARKEFVSKETISANMRKNHWSKTKSYIPPKGVKRNAETRLKMKEAHKKMPLKECPHCGYTGKPVTLNRWHYDKCKYKEIEMTKDTKNVIFIDDVEYDVNEMTDNQKTLISHIADLDRKIAGSKFSLDQMQVGRDAFFAMLKTALEPKPEE